MLPPDVAKNLDDWLLVVYEERNRTLNDQFHATQNKFAAAGRGQSGALIGEIVRLAAAEVTIRAAITTERFLRAADDAGIPIDDGFRPYGRTEIDRRIRFIILPEVRCRVGEMAVTRNMPQAFNHAIQDVDMAADRAVRRYQSELDSLITRHKANRAPQSVGQSTLVHVSGTVGVLQFGSHNSAMAVQNIDSSATAAIDGALDTVSDSLQATAESALPEARKQELQEIIGATRSELKKASPNWTLVGSLLIGVGGAIQTVAAMQPAYLALKGALSAVGINLP